MAPLSAEHTRRLELFNEKTDKLMRSRFKQTMFDQQTGVTISWTAETNEVTTTTKGPEEDSVDAFVLTLRFFLQDRDGISFRSLTEIYDAEDVPADLRDEFHKVRDAVNGRLDGQPTLAFNVNGEVLTRRRILDVFLYGGLSHVEATKQKTYDSWRGIPMFFALIENEFMATMAEIFNCILWVQHLNNQLLAPAPAPDAA
jgi:hypothetical protein